MNLISQYEENVKQVINKIDSTQNEAMYNAGKLISKCISNGGIIQSFGSGHSFSGALEVAGRAGGYIGSKAISEFSNIYAWLEVVDGVGTEFIKQVDIKENDCFIIISNSGKNPLHSEVASYIKSKNLKLIVVTNLNQSLKTKVNFDKKLYEYADVVIDNCCFDGDCSININKYDLKVGPISTIAVSYILNKVILNSYEILLDDEVVPPVFKSANCDGGREYNAMLLENYQMRLNRV